jgi:hypothetical protein
MFGEQTAHIAQEVTTITSTSNPTPKERLYTLSELEQNTALAVIAKFNTTKAKWQEFLAFDKATPLERVLNLTPLKSQMTELMLLSVANFEEVKDKRYFYQKDKVYYKEQIENRLIGLFKSIQPNRMLFIELIYNLYGYYFIAKHGTKEETMNTAVSEAVTAIRAQKATKTIDVTAESITDTATLPKPSKHRRHRKAK